MRGKRITRHNAYIYDCHVCDDRYIGYGDNDEKLQNWLNAHNNWHTQGIQEAGRRTMKKVPPAGYLP